MSVYRAQSASSVCDPFVLSDSPRGGERINFSCLPCDVIKPKSVRSEPCSRLPCLKWRSLAASLHDDSSALQHQRLIVLTVTSTPREANRRPRRCREPSTADDAAIVALSHRLTYDPAESTPSSLATTATSLTRPSDSRLLDR